MKESNELFQALTKVVRYLSFDKNMVLEDWSLDWKTLVKAVQEYQEVLKANNIGVENNERQRIEQSARRVGLEVPIGFDNDKESDFKKD
ncbi:hypothetical protein Gasu2_29070 [Galdieria sulphuraria]|nr:hypothetical protein Gasu2_29070 [Galdieria sulphuraria]